LKMFRIQFRSLIAIGVVLRFSQCLFLGSAFAAE
jgi:hypothetical protein